MAYSKVKGEIESGAFNQLKIEGLNKLATIC